LKRIEATLRKAKMATVRFGAFCVMKNKLFDDDEADVDHEDDDDNREEDNGGRRASGRTIVRLLDNGRLTIKRLERIGKQSLVRTI
jgi:hypothetical protein